MGIESGVAN